MHYPKASLLNLLVFTIASGAALACIKIVGDDYNFVVNCIAGVIAFIATGVACGSFFQAESNSGIAYNALRILLFFILIRGFMLFTAYGGGQYDAATDFQSFIEIAFFTEHVRIPRMIPRMTASAFNLIAIALVTTFYYSMEEERMI